MVCRPSPDGILELSSRLAARIQKMRTFWLDRFYLQRTRLCPNAPLARRHGMRERHLRKHAGQRTAATAQTGSVGNAPKEAPSQTLNPSVSHSWPTIRLLAKRALGDCDTIHSQHVLKQSAVSRRVPDRRRRRSAILHERDAPDESRRRCYE